MPTIIRPQHTDARQVPLAETVGRLIASPELRLRLGQQARALAEAEFSDKQVAKATVDLYAGNAKARAA